MVANETGNLAMRAAYSSGLGVFVGALKRSLHSLRACAARDDAAGAKAPGHHRESAFTVDV